MVNSSAGSAAHSIDFCHGYYLEVIQSLPTPTATQRPQITSGIHYLLFGWFDDMGHPAVSGIYRHPYYIALFVGIYLYFVLQVGVRMMADRKPLQLSGIMKVYNIVNILINLIICSMTIYFSKMTIECWGCKDWKDIKTVPKSWKSPEQLGLWVGEAYLALKIFDLLDTVFFVLRKKWNQITTLHVFHHSIMPFTAYAGIKFGYSPMCGLVVILNTFVHTIMYYYYHLASLGQTVWWKKYITVIQLVQFYIALAHSIHILFLRDCSYPKLMTFVQATEAVYFIINFTRFYLKTYPKKDSVKVTITDVNNNQVKCDHKETYENKILNGLQNGHFNNKEE